MPDSIDSITPSSYPNMFEYATVPRAAPVNDAAGNNQKLSKIPPFMYDFSIDIGRAFEGAPSTLLQECSSITQRNEPRSCRELCVQQGVAAGDALDQCRMRKLRAHECCDIGIFYAGETARTMVDDVFSGKIDPTLLDAELGYFAEDVNEQLHLNSLANSKIVASPYLESGGQYGDDFYVTS